MQNIFSSLQSVPMRNDPTKKFRYGSDDAIFIKRELDSDDHASDENSTNSKRIPSIDMTEISNAGSELNILLHDKLSALLRSDPKLCFTQSTPEQKRLSRLLYLVGNYFSNQAPSNFGHTDPLIKEFFNRSYEDFYNNYLASFLSKLPSDFGQVKMSNKMMTPHGFIKKTCNDNFRQRFRRRCIQKAYQL